MRTIVAVRAACLTVLAAGAPFAPAPAFAKNLPTHERTADGTWDCRDPAGTFVGTLIVAQETYALMKTDGRLAGYGQLRLLDFDTHLPNFAVISGVLKDELGSGAVALTGPRENYEEISGELFLAVAVSTDRNESLYCTGRHAPDGLM